MDRIAWKQLGPEEPNQNSSGPLGDRRVPNHEVTLQLVVCFPERTRVIFGRDFRPNLTSDRATAGPTLEAKFTNIDFFRDAVFGERIDRVFAGGMHGFKP